MIGNLTRDPEVKALPSGINVATLALATNRVWKDKNGQKQEDTQYHNIVVFGRQADTVAQYMKKGSSLMVEGRLQTRSWEDKAGGGKKYRTEIVADRVQFGPKSSTYSGGGSVTGQSFEDAEPKSQKGNNGAGSAGGAIEYPSEDINPDDIPF